MGISEAGDPVTPIADLHCHYPMHLLARDPDVQKALPRRVRRDKVKNVTLEYVIRVRRHRGLVAKIRAFLVLIFACLQNFRSYRDTWRVDLAKLRRGGVRIVCSVLYLPFAEIADGPEQDGDYRELLCRLKEVEDELAREHELAGEPEGSRPVVVTTEDDLDLAIRERRIAIMHCVEGGFHLGRDEGQITERVSELSR